ncbi:hypothetical protein E1200_01190 [Actinomadura sp. GC306]|nr:hypothetical protein E1200_01190 [Actinomadura sp. GC306]
MGTVSPVPPERDRDGDGIDDSVQESEPPPEQEPTEGPEPTEEEGPTEVPESPQDEESADTPSTPEESPPEEAPTQEPGASRDEQRVPPDEEQIEQCAEQTGSPEACREKIDP